MNLDIDTMLDADRWVRFALGASPAESIDRAAERVVNGHAAGVAQPHGAIETALVVRLPRDDPWEMMLRARDVARKMCAPRAVGSPSGSEDPE